jgi:hypothetical protein
LLSKSGRYAKAGLPDAKAILAQNNEKVEGLGGFCLTENQTHLITLTDLEPATTYYFRISSADSSGNRSTTAGLTFSTKNDQKAVANKAIKDIKKVTDPKELHELKCQFEITSLTR